MKKLLSMLLVATMLVMCVAGCGGSGVEGNTYTYKDLKIEGDVPEEIKDYLDEMKEAMSESFEGVQISFKADGKATLEAEGQTKDATYTVDGDKITVKNGDGENMPFVLDGSNLNLIQEEDGIKITFVFKKK